MCVEINEILFLKDNLHLADEEVGVFYTDDSDREIERMHYIIEEFIVFSENNNTEIDTLECKSTFIDNEDEAPLDGTSQLHRYLIIPRWLTSNHRPIYKVKPRYLLQM